MSAILLKCQSVNSLPFSKYGVGHAILCFDKTFIQSREMDIALANYMNHQYPLMIFYMQDIKCILLGCSLALGVISIRGARKRRRKPDPKGRDCEGNSLSVTMTLCKSPGASHCLIVTRLSKGGSATLKQSCDDKAVTCITSWHRSGSTLAQVMACSLTVPNHYPNQYWLITKDVLWRSTESNNTSAQN